MIYVMTMISKGCQNPIFYSIYHLSSALMLFLEVLPFGSVHVRNSSRYCQVSYT